MTGTKWADRLTPFTAGMALALLVVAVVVHPARAESTCTRCRSYWSYRVNTYPSQYCPGLSGYALYNCQQNKIHSECTEECSKIEDGPTGYVTCTDGGCSFLDGDDSICNEQCWNRTCLNGSGVDNGGRCRDQQVQPCNNINSAQCVECRCSQ